MSPENEQPANAGRVYTFSLAREPDGMRIDFKGPMGETEATLAYCEMTAIATIALVNAASAAETGAERGRAQASKIRALLSILNDGHEAQYLGPKTPAFN